ncbi:Tyrosine-protein kinase Fps85D, partial [Trichostrongylus colubriformis]
MPKGTTSESSKTEVLFKRAIRLGKWEFTPQSVQVGKLLSTGAYGEVRQGKLTKKDGSVVDAAVKMMKGRSETCRQQVKEMVREARLMRDLSHPNIVHFYGVCLQEQPIYILLELVQGGPLDVYLLENKSTIDKDEKLQIVMGVAWALEYLHSKSVLHRDIAAKNCLYDTSKTVKISDFGLARQGTTYAMRTARKMPIKWMAPESIRTFSFSQKSDVYNYGV